MTRTFRFFASEVASFVTTDDERVTSAFSSGMSSPVTVSSDPSYDSYTDPQTETGLIPFPVLLIPAGLPAGQASVCDFFLEKNTTYYISTGRGSGGTGFAQLNSTILPAETT